MTTNDRRAVQSQKSPAEKLAVYGPWLTAYRQNQASIIALEQFATTMSEVEQAAFNAAKATTTWEPISIDGTAYSIADMYNTTTTPTHKLVVYTQWLEAYRAAQANA